MSEGLREFRAPDENRLGGSNVPQFVRIPPKFHAEESSPFSPKWHRTGGQSLKKDALDLSLLAMETLWGLDADPVSVNVAWLLACELVQRVDGNKRQEFPPAVSHAIDVTKLNQTQCEESSE